MFKIENKLVWLVPWINNNINWWEYVSLNTNHWGIWIKSRFLNIITCTVLLAPSPLCCYWLLSSPHPLPSELTKPIRIRCWCEGAFCPHPPFRLSWIQSWTRLIPMAELGGRGEKMILKISLCSPSHQLSSSSMLRQSFNVCYRGRGGIEKEALRLQKPVFCPNPFSCITT